jgi:hypothetical protein
MVLVVGVKMKFFELSTFKMTFPDRIAVREIDVCALLCGRRPF